MQNFCAHKIGNFLYFQKITLSLILNLFLHEFYGHSNATNFFWDYPIKGKVFQKQSTMVVALTPLRIKLDVNPLEGNGEMGEVKDRLPES